jgi:hypothetical protein
MILTDKDNKKIMIECECGCSGLEFNKFDWEDGLPKEYYISGFVNTFYSEQRGFFYKLKNKIKTIWYILRYGTHRYQEICLTEKDLKDLKEIIKSWQ